MIYYDHSIRVYYRDVDQMGIVYNTRYLEYFEESRTELLSSIGLSVSKIESSGITLPVISSYCKYFISAKFEQNLIVRSEIRTTPKARLKIYYKITLLGESDIITEGFTEHAFVNKKNKPVKVPAFILNQLTFDK
jgi:acyl-CoA thioester hydrolase, YbgC/YbaW family